MFFYFLFNIWLDTTFAQKSVETGVESLDRSQLPDYLKLKYGTLAEGGAALGGMQQVIDAYIGFQKQLYSPGN